MSSYLPHDPARPPWLHASHPSTSWTPQLARFQSVLHARAQARAAHANAHAAAAAAASARDAATGVDVSSARNNLAPLSALQLDAAAAKHAHRHARGDHLPDRGGAASWAALQRRLVGAPPLGTAADADQLSDEEILHETVRDQVASYGERHIIHVGKARTRYEDDFSLVDEGGMPGVATAGNGDGTAAQQSRNSVGNGTATAAAATEIGVPPTPNVGTVGGAATLPRDSTGQTTSSRASAWMEPATMSPPAPLPGGSGAPPNPQPPTAQGEDEEWDGVVDGVTTRPPRRSDPMLAAGPGPGGGDDVERIRHVRARAMARRRAPVGAGEEEAWDAARGAMESQGEAGQGESRDLDASIEDLDAAEGT